MITDLSTIKYQILFSWLAVFCYIAATFLFAQHIYFQKKHAAKKGFFCAFTGIFPHAAAIIIRWIEVGHGPYMARYEVLSSVAFVSVVFFLSVTMKIKELRQTGVIVMPLCFLMMALGLFANPAIQNMPPSLRSVWLVIHIMFNKIAAASIIISFGCAIFYLLKQKMPNSSLGQKINSDLAVLDDYSHKFIGFGFVFWTITIAAGAIWANQAWGRYWGWDPIESWALITWLLFGIYLHLRHFHRWHGTKAAWLMIFCFISSIITLFIIPLLVKSIHSQYFS